jgi:hypothetical protein
MYKVFKQLANGEFANVATRDEPEQAVQLVEALNAPWPGKYIVQDPERNYVDLPRPTVISPECCVVAPSDKTFKL